MEKFDGICMQLIAIGEGLKNIDKVTNNSLLPNYSEINWKGGPRPCGTSLVTTIYGWTNLEPLSPVQGAVLDGFGNVIRFNARHLFKIGNGSCDFQDAVECPGGEPQFVDGGL